MKIHFVTFASSVFRRSLSRIKQEANSCGFFDTVTCWSESDLPLKYKIRNIFWLNRFTRGYGYWMWKSYVTKRMLQLIEHGDILLYVDAGSVINIEGRERFNEYIKMLQSSRFSNLSFQMMHLEKQYSKGDLFKYLGLENNEKIKNTGMLVGGVFFIRKDDEATSLVDEWYSICHNKKKLIDDSRSFHPNEPEFIEHRHDQSVFSLLRKLKGSLIIKDEVFFTNWDANKKYPIHTKRIK